MSGRTGAGNAGAAGGGGGADGDPVNPPPDVDQNNRPMTYDEKRTLSLGINTLSGPRLSKIIQLIKDTEPSLEQRDNNEFEIDFEKLHPQTLRVLETYVKSVIPPSIYDNLGEEQQSEDEL